MDRIAILIPCYNESKTIGKVISEFRNELPDAVIYVYDNNSTDGTAEIAKKAGAVVRYEHQQGKGNVIRRMFREVNAHCYLMVDGDDTYPAGSAKDLVRPVIERDADMVVGDRLSSTYFDENKRPFHNFGNSFVRKTINKIFRCDIKDIMTGYRAFSYQFVKTFPVRSKGFEIETEMTIHAVEYNMQVENVVVQYQDRPEGSESKLNTYSDGFRVIKMIEKLYRNYHPFAYFGIIAAILAAISIIVGSDVSSVSIATIVMQTIVTINTLPRWRNHELKANGRSGLSSCSFFNRQLAAINHSITATTPSTNAGSKRVGESSTGSADAAACSAAKIMASHHVARNIFLKFPVYSW